MPTTRQILIFSDFDGTIFLQDTGHILFNTYGCGPAHRESLDAEIKTGQRSFQSVSEEMWGSLDVPFDDGFKALEENLTIDPDFKAFQHFCGENGIPFNVISAGLTPVLRRVLDYFIGQDEAESIGIVANDADIDPEGHRWRPMWRHPSTENGHDKARSIQEYKSHTTLETKDGTTTPLIVFIGDGISDLPAAREADILFARRGLALEQHCNEHGLEYFAYDTFADIQREITRLTQLDEEKTKGEGLPRVYNPRANVWRRASSRSAVPMFRRASSMAAGEKGEDGKLLEENLGEKCGFEGIALQAQG
jgi:2,3-diketo-5-methylthio-1-phosphopentane phosphatase